MQKFLFTNLNKMMNGINNNSPSFGAKFINYESIRKLSNETGKYKSQKVSFVEIDPYNEKDIHALEKISKTWTRGIFSRNFETTAKWIPKLKNNKKVYALTLQNDKHENLDDTLILGLAEIQEYYKKYAGILYLQANPEIIYYPKRIYKDIGSKILSSLKEKYEELYLESLPTSEVKHFYRKNKFKESFWHPNYFVWKKGILYKLKQIFGLK